MTDENLGGTMNHVIKTGDTVHRQVMGHPLLHTILAIFRKNRYDGSTTLSWNRRKRA